MSDAIGVGSIVPDNPDAVASVRGVDGTSRNNDRFDIITLSFEVATNAVEHPCCLHISVCFFAFNSGA